MFISEEKLEVTQISLTGTRALALIGLLIIEPLSFEEIRKEHFEYACCLTHHLNV